jgi:hypothetical protein
MSKKTCHNLSTASRQFYRDTNLIVRLPVS